MGTSSAISDFTHVFKDKETTNWFKASIALKVTKEGLEQFVDNEIHNVHTAVGKCCAKCSIENVLKCPTTKICTRKGNCSFHSTPAKQYSPCLSNVCDKVQQNIIDYHRYTGPSWKNTKAELWATDYWEVAKCFFPPDGYINVSSVQETDFNGVISILLNCTHFDSRFSFNIAPKTPAPECILTKARLIGRQVRHTSSCKVSDAELLGYIQTFTTLLSDPNCLALDASANSACTKLNNLQNERFSITHEELCEYLRDAQTTLERKATEIRSHECERVRETIDTSMKLVIQEMEEKTNAFLRNLDERACDISERNKQAAKHKDKEDYESNLQDLLDLLKKYYDDTFCHVTVSPFMPKIDKPLRELYVTPKMHRLIIEKDGSHRKTDAVLKYKDLIYTGGKKNRRIFIQGEPGTGKSTFATKLVLDWCNKPLEDSKTKQTEFDDVDSLLEFRFVFLITLRDSPKQNELAMMIQDQILDKLYSGDDRVNAHRLLQDILKRENCLVIQDGLDNWNDCKGKLVMPLMVACHYNCTVLFTTRPWKLVDERIKNSQIDNLLELEDVSDPSKIIENIFRCLVGKDMLDVIFIKNPVCVGDYSYCKWVDITHFFKKNNLYSKSSPMMLTLAVCTWMYREHLTESKCEIYSIVLDCHFKNAGNKPAFFDHPPVLCFTKTKYIKDNLEYVDVLAKTAYYTMFSLEKHDSPAFSDKDLSKYVTSEQKHFAIKTGILTERRNSVITSALHTCSFTHRGVQEFLAAYYMASHINVIDDEIPMFLAEFSYPDMLEVFMFLCGLNIKAANKLSVVIDDHISTLDHRNCRIWESVILSGFQEATYNKVYIRDIRLQCSHINIYYGEESYPEPAFVHLASVNTSNIRSLALYGFGEDKPIFKYIQSTGQCLVAVPKTLSKVNMMQSYSDYLEDSIEVGGEYYMFDMFSFLNLETLDLFVNEPLSDIISKLTELKNLSIIGNRYHLDLSHNQNLETLSITVGVQLKPKTLCMLTKLRSLSIDDFYVNLDDCSAFFTANSCDIPLPNSLQEIRFTSCQCTPAWLRRLLISLSTLQHSVECKLFNCVIRTTYDSDDYVLDVVESPQQLVPDMRNVMLFCLDDGVCEGLYESLNGMAVEYLNMSYVKHGCLLSTTLTTLTELRRLRIASDVYLDCSLPPNVRFVRFIYKRLTPPSLRDLLNRFFTLNHRAHCDLVFGYDKALHDEYSNIHDKLNGCVYFNVEYYEDLRICAFPDSSFDYKGYDKDYVLHMIRSMSDAIILRFNYKGRDHFGNEAFAYF